MIVQPDFIEHWKTSLLIELLDDPCAPLYVIRLWGHCQNRKTHRFQRVNPIIIKAICKAPHDAELFENAMVDAGFIRIEDGEVIAHDWDVINASLIANWTNGKKGGRPKKQTHGIPMDNPDITDKRREEKIEKRINKPMVKRKLNFGDNEKPWIPIDYKTLKLPLVETRDDLFAIDDPVTAAMAVTGETDITYYGHWINTLNLMCKKMTAVEAIKKFMSLVEKIWAEKRCGEYPDFAGKGINKLILKWELGK